MSSEPLPATKESADGRSKDYTKAVIATHASSDSSWPEAVSLRRGLGKSIQHPQISGSEIYTTGSPSLQVWAGSYQD